MAAEAAAGAFTHSATELVMTSFADLAAPTLTLRWQWITIYQHEGLAMYIIWEEEGWRKAKTAMQQEVAYDAERGLMAGSGKGGCIQISLLVRQTANSSGGEHQEGTCFLMSYDTRCNGHMRIYLFDA